MKKKQRIKGRKSAQGFWDKEYAGGLKDKGGYLALSDEPSEDLQKFVRFLERDSGREYLNPMQSVVDLGCGNGRNLVYLSREFGVKGTGYDIAHSAIVQAKKASEGHPGGALPLTYEVRSIAGPLPFPNESQAVVLDMMVSHFLGSEERKVMIGEVARVLKPGGWFFLKTFLLDEDKHAKRLLEEHPSGEAGSYIHPEIRVAEHVSTQEELVALLAPFFKIHKIHKSHGHLKKTRSAKRRSISVYAERLY
jgi:SAM-dependent methyltransferase